MMKQITSHSYRLEELVELRGWNRKSFRISSTKERSVFYPSFKRTQYYGRLLTEFHIKPIHYLAPDETFRDIDEIALYSGNRNGLILKYGWENKIDFRWLLWYIKRQVLIRGSGVRVGRIGIPLLVNTVSDFYPDPNPETTSVDGYVGGSTSDVTWASLHNAADGAVVDDSATFANAVQLNAGASSGNWNTLHRGFFLFDTSTIPDTDTIDSGTMSPYVTTVNDTIVGAGSISLVTVTPASNTALALADYDQYGTVQQASDLTLASLTSGAYNDFTLNAAGKTSVSKTGVTKFGIILNADRTNTEPTWGAGQSAAITVRFAENVNPTDPKLSITHSAAAVSANLNLISLLGVG